ncbi:MAG TPA: copper-containing nitrite reductase [Anaerolineales bacterium]|nr:copper-containing nitrite reductase [Anaerolineales bacterium]
MARKVGVLALTSIAALLLAACGQSKENNRITYSLKSSLDGGQMVYVGMGGAIDGVVNPRLQAKVGDILTINFMSGEGAEHNIVLPDFNANSGPVVGQGSTASVTFGIDRPGTFAYLCDLPGHREAGMEGVLEVAGSTAAAASAPESSTGYGSSDMPAVADEAAPADAPGSAAPGTATGVDITRDPTDLPGPLGGRGPENVRLDLTTTEVVGQLADGTTFTYWTFNDLVPGPFFRVRVGDTVEVHLKNSATSTMPHSVDFHAVTGPGGGAVFTSSAPGQETSFSFMPLNPGLYVYHCATPMVALHIANGMYGLILVEPEGGLAPVDREFYVMQGEIYTTGNFGDQGAQTADVQKLLDERPDYYVVNGAVNALTTQHPLKANVGETVRIYFGVGGPNQTSAFHVIGEIFDRVFNLASLTAPPLTDVQTVLVPPGGAAVVEFGVEVPGRYILVDHALSRLQRGLAGYLLVEGPEAPEIFSGTPVP